MKRFFKSAPFLVLLVATFGVGVYFAGSATAQEATTDSSNNLLIQKIDSLVDALAALTDQSSSAEETASSEGGITTLSTGANHGDPTCLDNYLSFPNSRFRETNAEWDTHNLTIRDSNSVAETSQFIDVNGDGLVDHLYSYRQLKGNGAYDGNGNPISAYYRVRSCLLLNNGTGWDISFRCVADIANDNGTNYLTYYGDCADI